MAVRLDIFRAPLASAALAFAFAILAPAALAVPQISQGTYTESASGGAACVAPNIASCTVTFPAVPAGKTLIVRSISCRIFHATAGIAKDISVIGTKGIFIPVPEPVIGSLDRRYVVLVETFTPFNPAQIPRIRYSVSPSVPAINMACTIAGELKP